MIEKHFIFSCCVHSGFSDGGTVTAASVIIRKLPISDVEVRGGLRWRGQNKDAFTEKSPVRSWEAPRYEDHRKADRSPDRCMYGDTLNQFVGYARTYTPLHNP